MVKREVLKIVNFLEDRLKEHGLHNARLIVFGSHATGQAHKGSDIDIAIVSDEFEGKDIFERAKMTQDAEILTVRTYRVPLDIVTLSTREYREGKSPIVEYVKGGGCNSFTVASTVIPLVHLRREFPFLNPCSWG